MRSSAFLLSALVLASCGSNKFSTGSPLVKSPAQATSAKSETSSPQPANTEFEGQSETATAPTEPVAPVPEPMVEMPQAADAMGVTPPAPAAPVAPVAVPRNCVEALGMNPTRVQIQGNNDQKVVAAPNGLLLEIDSNNPTVRLDVEAPAGKKDVAGICIETIGNSTDIQISLKNAVLGTLALSVKGNVNQVNVRVDADAEVKRSVVTSLQGNNNQLNVRGAGKLGCSNVLAAAGLRVSCTP